MKQKKYNPQEFAKEYAPLKSRGLGQREIAAQMNISRSTLQSYLANENYAAQSGPVLEQERQGIVDEGKTRSGRMIDAAYALHERAIGDAIRAGNYHEARQAALDGLKVCKTEAEVKRIFGAVGVLNVNFQTLVLKDLADEDYKTLQHKFYSELWGDVKEKGEPCPFLLWGNRPCELKSGDE